MRRRIVLPAGQGDVEVLARAQFRVQGRKARVTLTMSKRPDQAVTLGPVRGIVTTNDNRVYDLYAKTWWRPLIWSLEDRIIAFFWRIWPRRTKMSVDIPPQSRHTIVDVLEASSRGGDGAS